MHAHICSQEITTARGFNPVAGCVNKTGACAIDAALLVFIEVPLEVCQEASAIGGSDQLSPGAVAGIVVGSVVGAMAFGLLLFVLLR